MKNLRKVLALVTMLTMLLSVAVSAGTLYPDVADDASYVQAVETLNALEVMVGDEKGNFNPDASITRAEAAAVVVRLKNLGDAANASGATVFTDVPADHWAAGYVNFAQQSGIINGYGDGTFGPSDPVTYEQIIKMVVAALGYTPEAEAKGGYPSGYMMVASQNDITKGVGVKVGAEAPRAAVARAAYNALEVPMMEQKGYGDNVTFEAGTKTLLANFLKVEKIEGYVAKTIMTEGGSVEDEPWVMIHNTATDSLTEELLVGDTDAIAYLGYAVEAYVAEDEDLEKKVIKGITKKAYNEELVLDASMITNVPVEAEEGDKKTLIIEYREDANSYDDLEADIYGATYIFNGKAPSTGEADEVKKFLAGAKAGTVNGTLKLISNEKGNDVYDFAILSQVSAIDVVTNVDAEYNMVETKDGDVIINLDDETVFTYFFKADGSVAELADIKVDDVLTAYTSKDNKLMSVYISDEKVEGALDEYFPEDGKTVYVVGGKEYRVAFVNGVAATTVDSNAESVVFYLDAEGNIAHAEVEKGVANYAFLYYAEATSSAQTGKAVELKVLTSEGNWEILTTSTNFFANNLVHAEDCAKKADATSECDKACANYGNAFKYAGGEVTDYVQNVISYKLGKGGFVTEVKLASYKTFDSNYRPSTQKYGSLNVADTMVFSVPKTTEFGTADTARVDEKEIKLVKATDLFTESTEKKPILGYGYNSTTSTADVVLAAGFVPDILEGTKFFVVKNLTFVKDEDGTDMVKLYGYQNGEEVSGTYYAEECEIKDRAGNKYTSALKEGDVVIFSLDADGNFSKIQLVMSADLAKASMGFGKSINTKNILEADGLFEAFGFVYKKDGRALFLAETPERTTTEPDEFGNTMQTAKYALVEEEGSDIALSIDLAGEGFNVYEVNLSNENAVSVSSIGKIKAVPNVKDAVANWAYVRMVDGEVVDVVVFTQKLDAAWVTAE